MIVPNTQFSEAHVARHYDELDRFYREIWGEHVHHGLWAGSESHETAVRQLVDVVAAEAEIKPDDLVLDIGSGYGAPARQISLDYGARVTGITLSPTQHEYAASRSSSDGNPVFVLGDWMKNDLPDERFDAVYAIESASHMPDPVRFVEEAVRVLKPDGRLVICAWTASEQTPPLLVRYLLEPICREGCLAHLSTATEYVMMLEHAGAHLTGFWDLSRKVRRTWTVALRRTFVRLATDPDLRRYVANPQSTQRVFLLTMLRMWTAYRIGGLRYCLIKARRDEAARVSANLA